MGFEFLHRPEPRKYNYKPRYYNPDEEENKTQNLSQSEEFGQRLHHQWRRKRVHQDKKSFFTSRSMFWLAFVVIILLIIIFKIL